MTSSIDVSKWFMFSLAFAQKRSARKIIRMILDWKQLKETSEPQTNETVV
jgi:hypothetical protein